MVATHQTVNTCFEYLQDISHSQLDSLGVLNLLTSILKKCRFHILSCQSLGDFQKLLFFFLSAFCQFSTKVLVIFSNLSQRSNFFQFSTKVLLVIFRFSTKHRSVNQTFIVNKKRGIISEGECPSHNITLHNKSFDTSSRHTLSRFTKYL